MLDLAKRKTNRVVATAKYGFLLAAILTNLKTLPFSWTIRFFYLILKHLHLAPRHTPPAAKSIFESRTYKSRNDLLECDLNMHKNNSTYFSDMDIARTDLLTAHFKLFFLGYKQEHGVWPYVPLGSVMTIFRAEIKPLQAYSITSRVLGWDDKWLFVISKFEIPTTAKDGTKGKKLAAIGLSKYVFKLRRKTIPPEEIVKTCGIPYTDADLQKGRIDFELAKGAMEAEAVADCPM